MHLLSLYRAAVFTDLLTIVVGFVLFDACKIVNVLSNLGISKA